MKPQKLALTQDYVDGLTIEPGQPADVSVYDTERKGLYVRLRRGAGGVSKTWYVGYQWRGKDRPHRLGSTDAYTLMEARDRARIALRDAEDGNDPKAKRAEAMQKKRRTFMEVAVEFIREKANEGKRSPSTMRAYTRYLTGPYFQPLHDIEFAKIEKEQIVERFDFIRDKGIIRASKNAASQARGNLIGLYDWAQLKGWVPDDFNPAKNTINPSPRRDAVPRDRKLSDDELVAIWIAAGDKDDYGRIIRLLILLGNRREEVAGMEWSELQDGIWTLPAERNKINRERRIPLSADALELIGERPAGRKRVFDSFKSTWSNEKTKLDDRLLGKLDAPFRVHDLRRTMRSGLTRLGVGRDLAEMMIGHIPPRIVRTYEIEEQIGEQAKAFGRWAAYVDGIVKGKVQRVAA